MASNRQAGYTFLELLLVLSVVVVLTAIILPIGDRWVQAQSEEEALNTFIATIHHAQAYSIANEVHTVIRSHNSGKSYTLFAPSSVMQSATDFPAGMHWSSSSNSMGIIEFHPDGHIIKSGTVILFTTKGRKRLTLQLQHGRVLVYDL